LNLCLSGALDAETLQAVRAALRSSPFHDGGATAGWNARGVKHNEQARDAEAAGRVHDALLEHLLLQSAALPARLSTPLFSRYRPGMSYGLHMDDALMGSNPRLRTDLALTLFLSDPASYDGGELVIENHTGVLTYKLEAGQAVLHRVAEVTRGERLAAVLWIQSAVRDAAHREMLFDLDTVRRSLWARGGASASEDFNLLNKTYANLLRAWADP
jgi:PKHD-type hydroxylase